MADETQKEEKKEVKVVKKVKLPFVGEYKLVNATKLTAALSVAGVLTDNEHDDAKLLVAYDALGGYIVNAEGTKVKNGSFYDVKLKKAHEKPQVVLLVKVGNTTIELEEGAEETDLIKAAKLVAKAEAKEKKEKAKKKNK